MKSLKLLNPLKLVSLPKHPIEFKQKQYECFKLISKLLKLRKTQIA